MTLTRLLRQAVLAALLAALALAGVAQAHPDSGGDTSRPAETDKPKDGKGKGEKKRGKGAKGRTGDKERGKGAKGRTGDKERGKGGKGKTQPVKLRFKGVAGNTPVRCGSEVAGLGTKNTTAALLDFRFYLTDVRLTRAKGGSVPVKLKRSKFQTTKGKEGVTLIDLENGTGACEEGTPATNPFVEGTVPRGKYTGVSWTLGVPFRLNHTNTVGAASPLDSLAMTWGWQIGRKFTKIELGDPTTPPSWQTGKFLVHVGSTGCEGDPAAGETVKCAASNRAKIALRKFNAKRQDVAVDIRALVAGNDVTVNGGNAPGCMSFAGDPECESIFRALGMRFSGGKAPSEGSMPAHGRSLAKQSAPVQTVFRAVKK